jgi:hypothetical protein
VLVVGAATVAIKATGPVLLAGRELPGRLLGVVEAVAGKRQYVFDARLLGLAAAVVAIRLRAPLLVTIVVAALVAAVARAV